MEELADERHKAGYFDHIQIWYEKLKEFTFETKFLPITKKEAQAMMKFREAARQLGSLINFTNNSAEIATMEPLEMIGEENKELLKTLTERLQEVIEKFEGVGCFVRLSTRSPKDAALNGEKVKEMIAEEIAKKKYQNTNSEECILDDVITYWRSISKAQKVKNAEEAMELLLRSNRVYEDLSCAELLLESEEDWDMQLIARKWEDIDPELELRSFVWKGKLIGITQYHKNCYVPFLHLQRDLIQQLIVSTFAKVAERLDWVPNQTYTIDFSITQSPENNHNVKVVEINSYPPIAGTSLFDWENDDDRQFLLGGGGDELQYRVLTSPCLDLSDFHPPLKLFINQLRHRLPPSPDHPKPSSCSLQ